MEMPGCTKENKNEAVHLVGVHQVSENVSVV